MVYFIMECTLGDMLSSGKEYVHWNSTSTSRVQPKDVYKVHHLINALKNKAFWQGSSFTTNHYAPKNGVSDITYPREHTSMTTKC